VGGAWGSMGEMAPDERLRLSSSSRDMEARRASIWARRSSAEVEAEVAVEEGSDPENSLILVSLGLASSLSFSTYCTRDGANSVPGGKYEARSKVPSASSLRIFSFMALMVDSICKGKKGLSDRREKPHTDRGEPHPQRGEPHQERASKKAGKSQ
jgi:hypothetical protein